MFWVVTEICSEPNVFRRSKIIKQFIKVARMLSKCLIKYLNHFFSINFNLFMILTISTILQANVKNAKILILCLPLFLDLAMDLLADYGNHGKKYQQNIPNYLKIFKI